MSLYVLVNHLGYCHFCVLLSLHICFLPLYFSRRNTHTHTHILPSISSWICSLTSEHADTSALEETCVHRFTGRMCRSVYVTVRLQADPHIHPATSRHDVVRQFHRRQDTMWKRIDLMKWWNVQLHHNCTNSPNVHMCIFNLQVPCSCYTFLFLFLSLILNAFRKERNNNMEALVYYYYYNYLLLLLLFLSTGAPTDGKRQLHILLSIFWGLCFLSTEQPPEVCRHWETSGLLRHQLCK